MKKTVKQKLASSDLSISVPMKWVGPLQFKGPVLEESVSIPLATFESPLWPSVERGIRVANLMEGVTVVVSDEIMTRSFAVEASSLERAVYFQDLIQNSFAELAEVVKQTSRFAKLVKINTEVVSQIIYVRLAINSADASGHNMVTKAADAISNYLLAKHSGLSYLAISANYCSDKKVSAVNGILGRGRNSFAEIKISRKVCQKLLRTSPEAICDLNTKKNLLGSILAGSLRSANAHYANILLAAYLATGQDVANIVEGSQGITFAEMSGDDLNFSVKIPNIIVGTVGNGKNLSFVKDNLEKMGCQNLSSDGSNSKRLAAIITGAVLCGELSLLAAITNQGELVKSHMQLER